MERASHELVHDRDEEYYTLIDQQTGSEQKLMEMLTQAQTEELEKLQLVLASV